MRLAKANPQDRFHSERFVRGRPPRRRDCVLAMAKPMTPCHVYEYEPVECWTCWQSPMFVETVMDLDFNPYLDLMREVV